MFACLRRRIESLPVSPLGPPAPAAQSPPAHQTAAQARANGMTYPGDSPSDELVKTSPEGWLGSSPYGVAICLSESHLVLPTAQLLVPARPVVESLQEPKVQSATHVVPYETNANPTEVTSRQASTYSNVSMHLNSETVHWKQLND
jgi:hypothetical protein